MQNNNEGTSSNINVNFSQNLNPWFITGFTDAEGSFILNINSKSD